MPRPPCPSAPMRPEPHEKTAPASAVSALVFAHKDAQYFALGQVDKDQIEEYATRKKMSVDDIEKWLAPILSYK